MASIEYRRLSFEESDGGNLSADLDELKINHIHEEVKSEKLNKSQVSSENENSLKFGTDL